MGDGGGGASISLAEDGEPEELSITATIGLPLVGGLDDHGGRAGVVFVVCYGGGRGSSDAASFVAVLQRRATILFFRGDIIAKGSPVPRHPQK